VVQLNNLELSTGPFSVITEPMLCEMTRKLAELGFLAKL